MLRVPETKKFENNCSTGRDKNEKETKFKNGDTEDDNDLEKHRRLSESQIYT